MGIGPSTKETTLHYSREPLVKYLESRGDVDLAGIIVLGTSDDNDHKLLVAQRAGAIVAAMGVHGAIISIDSWGNTNIDFANAIEAVGDRDIPLAGLCFSGTQGTFVVKNAYMEKIIDLNKTSEGIETCVLGQNSLVELDAVRAFSVLESRMRKAWPGMRWSGEPCLRKRRLMVRGYAVADAHPASQTSFRDGLFLVDTVALAAEAMAEAQSLYPQVRKVACSLIRPGDHDIKVNSILDVAPLATKAKGPIGEGITHRMDGLQVMLTAVEEGGFMPINIGCAAGRLADAVCFDRCGTPGSGDFILHIDVLLAEGEARTREGITAAHKVGDFLVNRLREPLKAQGHKAATTIEEYWETSRPQGCRIALVKLVSGLGCMYDTVLFPKEPGGCLGGRSIMDLSNNMPVLVSVNEIRDGALRSLS